VAERALVIVPTYNEATNLRQVVPQVLAQDPRLDVLVIDDNSPDGTGRLADDLAAADPRVHVLHRPGKLGLGTAYIAGFRWALERDYDYVFEMDADLSHDPTHLKDFLTAVEGADLVLGSRYLGGRVTVVNWPMGRLVLSYCANIYARWITGLRIWAAWLAGATHMPWRTFAVWNAADLGLSDAQVGAAGATYDVKEIFVPEKKSRVEIFGGSPEEAVSKLVEKLRKEAKVL